MSRRRVDVEQLTEAQAARVLEQLRRRLDGYSVRDEGERAELRRRELALMRRLGQVGP